MQIDRVLLFMLTYVQIEVYSCFKQMQQYHVIDRQANQTSYTYTCVPHIPFNTVKGGNGYMKDIHWGAPSSP